MSILDRRLHGRKLKRGTLDGNRFTLTVRALEGDLEQTEERLETIRVSGVPNYFGPQRFGHGGQNVARGASWLKHGGRLPRNKKSIYISAVRSFIFNEVLSRRVDERVWNQLLDGDIASLDGSRSTFVCELPDRELTRRCEAFDIHPSGPLPGKTGAGSRHVCLPVEQCVLDAHEELVKGLEKAGVKSDRRSLRLAPGAMSWDLSDNILELEFELPPGGYATSVLRELVTSSPVSISEST